MLRVVTLKDYKKPEKIKKVTDDLRSTFASVFTSSYTRQLAPVLKKALDNKEYKKAEELKESRNPILKGFSDLLCKKVFFKEELPHYAKKDELKKVFHEIMQGAGFDDDGAFILAFHDLNLEQSKDAADHYEKIKSRLEESVRKDVEDYLQCLKESKRELKEVNFIAFVDKENKVRGFAIFHVIRLNNETILHIRQAAMLQQGRGYASVMAAYFADHYPGAIYEANQRKANNVLMKNQLVKEELIRTIDPVLGYNKEYYFAWRGKDTILKLFLKHQANNHPTKALCTKAGKYFEAESIVPFFSQAQLQKDLFALQDDNFCKDETFLLRKTKM